MNIKINYTGENMEVFKSMSLDEIRDWFDNTTRPMSTLESGWYV